MDVLISELDVIQVVELNIVIYVDGLKFKSTGECRAPLVGEYFFVNRMIVACYSPFKSHERHIIMEHIDG